MELRGKGGAVTLSADARPGTVFPCLSNIKRKVPWNDSAAPGKERLPGGLREKADLQKCKLICREDKNVLENRGKKAVIYVVRAKRLRETWLLGGKSQQ